MKLLTAAIAQRFAEVGSQEAAEDPIVIAKFFDPCGRGTWFATEFEPEERLFFGWCTSPLGPDCDEWGYFSLDELAQVRGPFGLGIERDVNWTERPLSAVRS